ncbi:MAG: hypothetical protein RQ885_11595 [Desulfurococcales archaeon]|jgi:hypothetical protein|nr:hypothetical protein [Desulfurococcales archaeon]
MRRLNIRKGALKNPENIPGISSYLVCPQMIDVNLNRWGSR